MVHSYTILINFCMALQSIHTWIENKASRKKELKIIQCGKMPFLSSGFFLLLGRTPVNLVLFFNVIIGK